MQQVRDVAQRCILRTFTNRSPFAAGELAVKAIEQFVEQFDLTLIHGRACPMIPKTGFGQDRSDSFLSSIDGSE